MLIRSNSIRNNILIRGFSRQWHAREYVQNVSLVIFDEVIVMEALTRQITSELTHYCELAADKLMHIHYDLQIHLLGQDRGPILEVIVSRMR